MCFIAECRDAFSLFDRNGDGEISVEELGSVLRSLGRLHSEEELKAILSEYDIDGRFFTFLKIETLFILQ